MNNYDFFMNNYDFWSIIMNDLDTYNINYTVLRVLPSTFSVMILFTPRDINDAL